MSRVTQEHIQAALDVWRAKPKTQRLADYIPVNVKVLRFRALYPDATITTSLDFREKGVVARAEVWLPEQPGPTTGHKFISYVEGKGDTIEKAETGAVGRALSFLGFEVASGIASAEDMEGVDHGSGGGARGTAGSSVPWPDDATRPTQPQEQPAPTSHLALVAKTPPAREVPKPTPQQQKVMDSLGALLPETITAPAWAPKDFPLNPMGGLHIGAASKEQIRDTIRAGIQALSYDVTVDPFNVVNKGRAGQFDVALENLLRWEAAQ